MPNPHSFGRRIRAQRRRTIAFSALLVLLAVYWYSTDLDRLFEALLVITGACILLMLIGLGVLFWNYKTTYREKRGLCTHCGYDLRATPVRCPECGHMVNLLDFTETHRFVRYVANTVWRRASWL